MDKNCILVNFDKDHLIIECGPVSFPPVINSDSTVVQDIGELPKGIYTYAVTALGVNGESAPYNLLQVNAPHKGNSIVLSWRPIPYITEYHIYRGKTYGCFDGYFAMFTRQGYFQDNGLGELNKVKTIPPEYTPIPDSFLNRKIHRASIEKVNSLFLNGSPYTIHIYLKLHSGEIITIDLMNVMNQPGWQTAGKHGLLRALSELGEWRDGYQS